MGLKSTSASMLFGTATTFLFIEVSLFQGVLIRGGLLHCPYFRVSRLKGFHCTACTLFSHGTLCASIVSGIADAVSLPL